VKRRIIAMVLMTIMVLSVFTMTACTVANDDQVVTEQPEETDAPAVSQTSQAAPNVNIGQDQEEG